MPFCVSKVPTLTYCQIRGPFAQTTVPVPPHDVVQLWSEHLLGVLYIWGPHLYNTAGKLTMKTDWTKRHLQIENRANHFKRKLFLNRAVVSHDSSVRKSFLWPPLESQLETQGEATIKNTFQLYDGPTYILPQQIQKPYDQDNENIPSKNIEFKYLERSLVSKPHCNGVGYIQKGKRKNQ